MSTPAPPPPPPVAPSAPPTPAAGWFPDPNGRHEHRYFNGHAWTADVADGGHRSVDPFGPGPTSMPGGPSPYQSQPSQRNGVATAALVCGIIGILLAWMPFIVVAGLILAVLALIFGIQGIRRAADGAPGRGVAIAGVVLGAIGMALSVLGVVLTVITWREVDAFISPEAHTVSVDSCTVSDGVALAQGTITNLSTKPADFTIFVTIESSDRRDQVTSPVQLNDVEAGATVDWRDRELLDTGSGTCTVSYTTYGPFPFGVKIDQP